MIEIVNGHFKRFDENVIIYSRLKPDPKQLFTIYATRDQDEIKRKILESKMDNPLEAIAMAENVKWVTETRHYDFLGIDYEVKSESDLFWSPTCVVFAGEHPTIEECRKQTLHGLLLYFGNVAMQKQKTSKQIPVITHEDIVPENLVEHITKEYINSAYHALGWGDKQTLNMLRQNFAIFSFGTSFYNDARRLFEQLQTTYDPDTTEKLLFTIAMKNAVEKEAFELAAELRDRLKGQRS